MIITPNQYLRKRLRTILAYKFIDADYTVDPATSTPLLFLPVDASALKVMNFKVTSNLSDADKFTLLSVGTDIDNLDVLSNDTTLWYEDIERGQIFDTKLDAYSVNTKFHRSESLKEYFHKNDLEGLYVYIDSSIPITDIQIYMIYEDLDSQ